VFDFQPQRVHRTATEKYINAMLPVQ
jgi:hypothetical protein